MSFVEFPAWLPVAGVLLLIGVIVLIILVAREH
jgi:hypothetical protein